MSNLKAQGTVCLLLGPDTDRDALAAFLEQSGYNVHAFKNPTAFFGAIEDRKPFVVVLETNALKIKLSEWVSQLQSISEKLAWITMAPISQYPILASYQNRGLVEIVASDSLYVRERLLWALDREHTKFQLKQVRALSFVEEPPPVMKPVTNILSETPQKSLDLGTLVDLRLQDAKDRQRPFLLGVLVLDDPQEIESFWGQETLHQVQEMLQNRIRETWGSSNFINSENKNFVLLNASTPDFLADVQDLQSQLQEQGRNQFGFRISISGGVCEAFVHARASEEMRRLALEACRHMASRGGGRVGIPRPLQGGLSGDIPQDLG